MEITVNNIKNYTPDMIYNQYESDIRRIYDDYVLGCFAYEKYKEIVLKAIAISIDQYRGREPYASYVKIFIADRVKKHIHKILNDNPFALKLLNTFINNNCIDNSTENKVVDNFYKITTFINNFNYLPTPDIIGDLLTSNANFSEMAKTYYNQHKKTIQIGYLYGLSNNYFLLETIEIFCGLNGIDIKLDKTNQKEEHNSAKILTREEERELANKVRLGDTAAKKTFAERNINLVRTIAKQYARNNEQMEELVQEGTIGLMTAIERFDPDKGYRFSTYATWWIRQAILLSFSKEGTAFAMSNCIYYEIKRFKRMLDEYLYITNIDERIAKVAKEMNIPLKTAYEYYKLQLETVNIYDDVKDYDDIKIIDFIPSDEEPIEDAYARKMLASYLQDIINTSRMKERSREILRFRYGFTDGKEHTLQETGDKFNVTRERIRQIENKAIASMRNNDKTKGLSEYTQNPEKALANLRSLIIQEYNKPTSKNRGTAVRKEGMAYDSSSFERTQTDSKRSTSQEQKPIYNNRYAKRSPIFDVIPESIPYALKLENERLFKEIFPINNLSNKAYENIINMIKPYEIQKIFENKNLMSLVSSIPMIQVLVLLLRLGYIDGHEYNFLQITSILDVDETTVLHTFRDILGSLNQNEHLYSRKSK